MCGLISRAVAHAKAGAEVLGKQLDCRTVVLGVGLCKVLYGLNKYFLAIDITMIGDSFALAARRVRSNGDRKNFSHAECKGVTTCLLLDVSTYRSVV